MFRPGTPTGLCLTRARLPDRRVGREAIPGLPAAPGAVTRDKDEPRDQPIVH
jgi:hypothetical protein